MRHSMHNIMSIYSKVGYPDKVLSMACYPQWPNARNALLPGQSFIRRPDIVASVFCIKLCVLMAFEIDRQVFGKVEAHVRGIDL